MNQKIKIILKSEYFILTVLTFIALLVRLLNIDKSYGLWNDEILCYSIAAKGLPFGIIKELWQIDYHMPLYYYYLGVWIHFFGNSDVALRMSSVLCGVLTVPAFYYMGKSFKSKNLGYFLAFVACFNPVMIYHSQELRFYSMLILFSALSITFMLKLIDKPSVRNYVLFGLSNLIILYIYALGGLFICIQWFVLFLHFIIYKKEDLAHYMRYSALFFVFALPYIIIFLIFQYGNSQQLVSSFAWGGPPTFDPVALVNDWFSPFLTNLKDGVGFGRFLTYFKSFKSSVYLLFLCLPTICFLIGIAYNLFKINKKILYIIVIAIWVLLTEIILWSQGDFHVVTRYTLIILPIILLVAANGIVEIKNNYLKFILISLIGLVYIYNIFNYKNADAFQMRYDGFRFPAEAIESFSSKGDYIVSSRYSDSYFQKYLKNYNAVEVETNKMFTLDKTKKTALRVFSEDLTYSTTKNNVMSRLTPYFMSPEPTPELRSYINSSIAKMPKGRKITLINGPYGDVPYEIGCNYTIAYLNSRYPEKEYQQIVFGIAVNKIRYDIENLLKNNKSLKFVGHYKKQVDSKEGFQRATWEFYVYKKI